MVVQIIILSIVLFFAPIIPTVLGPIGYSMTGALLVQKANPRTLSIITISIILLTNTIIWISQGYIINRINSYRDTKKTDIFSRTLQKTSKYFDRKTKSTKLGLKREKYAENKYGKFFIFLFAIFCFLPFIPDIVGNRLLYKKIKFPYFILAVLIGKIISHVPFIFFGKGLVSLLKI